MSDTCFFSMNILKTDRDKVTEIMLGGLWTGFRWPEEEDNGDGTVTLVEYDANNGYLDQRKEYYRILDLVENFLKGQHSK